MVMPASRPHGAGLRAFVAGLFNERNFGLEIQFVEATVQDRIPMKIDASAILRLYESVVLQRKKFRDLSMRQAGMSLHVTSRLANIILQLAPHRLERIAHGEMCVR